MPDRWQFTPGMLRRLHGCATVGWAAMIPVAALTDLKNSVPFLVAISVYALAGAHFSAWQASRVETGQADSGNASPNSSSSSSSAHSAAR